MFATACLDQRTTSAFNGDLIRQSYSSATTQPQSTALQCLASLSGDSMRILRHGRKRDLRPRSLRDRTINEAYLQAN